jgi:hypothetical protein
MNAEREGLSPYRAVGYYIIIMASTKNNKTSNRM